MAKLNDYCDLIDAIPIARHSVEVETEFWEKEFQAANQVHIFKRIFDSKPTVRISRNKILKTKNGIEKCALVLLWGYTKGMRGSQHKKYLENLSKISKFCSFEHKIWKDFYKAARQIRSLGISTITKLAYFHGLEFDGNPALILDQRIIDVLSKSHWKELKSLSHIKYNSASKNYVVYLEQMKRTAFKLKVDGAKLEFFLFGMGNAFD